MMEAKDPAIKLFGRMIPSPEIPTEAAETVESELDYAIRSVDDELDDDDSLRKEEASPPSDHFPDKNDLNGDEESANTQDSLTNEVNNEEDIINHNSLESTTIDDVTTTSSKEDEENGSKSQDKTLKKPDKILPCPRCNSMDTKFCYYNNYNVNQPRHYCKRCQRYWTAGGIMRNVPIGAGRRKNKNLVVDSQCRRVNLSDVIQNDHNANLRNGTHPNYAVLTFGYDHGRLQESRNTGLKIAGKTLTKPRKSDTSKEGQSDDPVQYSHSVLPQPWPYPWSPNPSVSAVSLNPSGYQLPFYPSTLLWGLNSIPNVWNAPNSPTLGKHSRDEGNLGKCIWIPKPSRIDDLGEASRSSLWKTLGIKMEKDGFVSEKSGFLNTTTSSVLQANPAAFSRSLNFRENT